MIVYTINADYIDSHFATLREAVKAAREEANHSGVDVEVTRNKVVPITKASLLDILNTQGGSWALESEVVKTIKAKEA